MTFMLGLLKKERKKKEIALASFYIFSIAFIETSHGPSII